MSVPVYQKAAISDVPSLLEIIREKAEYEDLLNRFSLSEDILKHNFFSEKTTAYFLVAKQGRDIIGFICYFFRLSSFSGNRNLYIDDMFVSEKGRDQGIGSELVNALKKVAQEEKCSKIELGVLDWNDKAIQFYEKHGAKEVFKLRFLEIE